MEAAERRRIQNREAQRRFREKKLASNDEMSSRIAAGSATQGGPANGRSSLRPRASPITGEKTYTSPIKNGHRHRSNAIGTAPQATTITTTTSSTGNSYSSASLRTPSRTPKSASLHQQSDETSVDYVNQLQETLVAMPIRPQSEMNFTDLNMPPITNSVFDTMEWQNSPPRENNTFWPDSWGIFPLPHCRAHCTPTASLLRNTKCSESTPHISTPESDHDTNNAQVFHAAQNSQHTSRLAPSLTSELGADNENSFQTSLHIAAESGHESMIDMLVGSGCIAIDEYDSDDNTALHVAVMSQKLAAVLQLLKYGANPDAENAAGWTPVHLAVRTGSVEIVEALVAHGGDLGKKARGDSV